MDDLAKLRARLDALEGLVRDRLELAKGEPGRDGKDGRDGRDGKSVSAQRMLSAIRGAIPSQRAPVVNFDPHINVQPAAVKAPDVAAPVVNVASTINVEALVAGQGRIAGGLAELVETLMLPSKPIYESGKLVGAARVKGVTTK